MGPPRLPHFIGGIFLDAEKLTTALFEKMKAEQNKDRAWLVTQPPEEILNHTYEDVCCKGEYQNPNTT